MFSSKNDFSEIESKPVLGLNVLFSIVLHCLFLTLLIISPILNKSVASFPFSPDVFDYKSCLGRPAYENLEHAFRVAREHLGIEPLLDPEGELFCLLFFLSIVVIENVGQISFEFVCAFTCFLNYFD